MKIKTYIKRTCHIISLILIGYCLTTCNSSNDNTAKTSKTQEQFSNDKEKMNYFKYRFPSSDELFYYIEEEELVFNEELMNSTDNTRLYLTKNNQALGLGVYMSDLSYISITENWENVNKCLMAIYKLSDKLRLLNALDDNSIERIESNIQNPDSLIDIADKFNDNILDYLIETGNEKMYGIIAFGSLIEYFHIKLNVTDFSIEENSFNESVSDHKFIIQNLTDYLSFYAEGDNKVEVIISSLNSYKEYFSFTSENEDRETEIEKLDDGTLIIKGGNENIIPKSDIDSLKLLTNTIRSRIINGEF